MGRTRVSVGGTGIATGFAGLVDRGDALDDGGVRMELARKSPELGVRW